MGMYFNWPSAKTLLFFSGHKNRTLSMQILVPWIFTAIMFEANRTTMSLACFSSLWRTENAKLHEYMYLTKQLFLQSVHLGRRFIHWNKPEEMRHVWPASSEEKSNVTTVWQFEKSVEILDPTCFRIWICIYALVQAKPQKRERISLKALFNHKLLV